MMNEEEIIKMFKEGFDCGQIITLSIAESLNLDKQIAIKSAAAFGGGIFDGDICGAFIGGLIGLGLKYGHDRASDPIAKAKMIRKVFEYKEEFYKLHCFKTKCCDILGYDLTNENDSKIIQEKNLLFTVCPKLVLDVINLVKKI